MRVDHRILSNNEIVAVNSTGIKVTKRGEWMREKWRVWRGWINVHAMIDVETDLVLGLDVTDESVQYDTQFTPLLDQASENCGKAHSLRQVLGDGGYDRIHVFNTMEKRGIKSGVKTRENAAPRSTGSPYRTECVRERVKSGGYREWADETGYGMRWKIEGVFSSVKQIFGESVTASSRQGMMREVMMKFNCYYLLVSMSVWAIIQVCPNKISLIWICTTQQIEEKIYLSI